MITFHWKVDTTDHPPQIFNWTLYLSILCFSILGAMRGLDEGCISGNIVLPSFKQRFGLSDPTKSADYIANLTSNITSMCQLGAILGSVIATKLVDLVGRVRSLQLICTVFMVAATIQITSKHVGQLYVGRLLEGVAVGCTTSAGPVYLAEVAPGVIRGLTGAIFAGSVYFGIMLEYFANYGSVLHISGTTTISGTTREPNDKQWQVTLIPKFALPFLILSMSIFFAVESPRWLVRIDRNQLALRNLAKLRNLPIDHPYVLAEISDINEQVMVEKQVSSDSNFCRCIKEIFTKKSIAYRFFMMGAMAQILGQWSGANAVTIYASKLFSLAGVKGDVGTLKMSAALGVVKFGSAYLGAFFLVDTLGRKKSLYTGLFLQLVSILYYAIFLTVVPQATTGDTWSLSSSQRQASKAALAAIFLSGVGWVIGANNTSYLLGSEIFPLHIRSFAQSLVMVVHFANQYGNSKALPKMMLAMHPYGAFYLFVGDLVVYLIWAYFLPELKGRSLESIEKIFTLPWYKLRYSDRLVPDHSQLCRIAHVGAGVGITQQGDDADKELEFLQTIDKRASPPTMIENLAESESSDDKEKEREVV